MLRGIDVYAGDGKVEWSLVSRAGNGFAFLKATEGVGFKDKAFAANRKAAAKCGLLVGAYHFLKPDTSGTDQAHHFLRTVGSLEGMLRPVVDVEDAGRAH